MLGRSLKEDLEREQLWIRKEIPACPLQLISCQTGTGDLIVSIKFACITHHITGGWSDPTTLFTLCLTCCLCWGKENCNYIYRLTSCIRLPGQQHWSSCIISKVMLGEETDWKPHSFWISKSWHRGFQWNLNWQQLEGSKKNISPGRNQTGMRGIPLPGKYEKVWRGGG